MEENNIEQGQDSLSIEKNSKGVNFSVKVYRSKQDSPEDLQNRLDSYVNYLYGKYDKKDV